jgi:RNA polymerase sigma-70 factor (ECF subfamily)
VSVVDAQAAITRAHREEWARVVAALTKRFGDLDIAEEAAAEAFAPPSGGGRPTAYPPIPAPG